MKHQLKDWQTKDSPISRNNEILQVWDLIDKYFSNGRNHMFRCTLENDDYLIGNFKWDEEMNDYIIVTTPTFKNDDGFVIVSDLTTNDLTNIINSIKP